MVKHSLFFAPSYSDHLLSDEAILVEEIRRNPKEFVKLYDRYIISIYRYIYSQVKNVKDTEDLTSQVFLSAFQNFHNYRHKKYFAPWLFTIARNKIKDFFRHSKQEVSIEEAERQAINPEFLTHIIHKETVIQLQCLIQSLPENEKELIRLRFVAELSFPQIAIISGQKEETIKKQLYRLLARLERQMEVEHE